MPPGAVISPPESAPNSSDEESTHQQRDILQLEELEAAVRSIEQRRALSPERSSPAERPSSSTISATRMEQPSRPPLTKEARKISHSRSATESCIPQKHEEAVTSSPEESERDDEPYRKQPMVRKKSGELVRPALRPPSSRRRPSSMPGTPTYAKVVHFDSQLEHIRHFLQLDKPQAVSANTSPVEEYNHESEFPFEAPSFEWDIRLSNFPKDSPARALQKVRLERLHLSSDKNTLVGVVAVANLAFHKQVAARFTFDYWRTVSEVAAQYNDDVRRKQINDGYDRFSFSIKLTDQANLEHKTMFVCIRYSVAGQEFWDNNNFMNYQVNFVKTPKPRPESRCPSTSSSRPALPRSKSFAGSHSRPHTMASSFDTLDNFEDMNDYLSFGRPKKTKEEPSPENLLKEVHSMNSARREKQNRQVFGNRYDFGASLSAVMRTKPSHDRTTLTAQAKSGNGQSNSISPAPAKKAEGLPINKATVVPQVSPQHVQPSSLLSSKPHHDSSVYKELVDKFCFYGSPKGPNGINRPVNKETTDLQQESSSTSSSPSPPLSPPLSPRAIEPLGIGLGDSCSSSASPISSSPRNASPSPTRFDYSHHPHIQPNFFKESHTPAAIRG
ncbi:protein phosphatase regulator GAC1 [Aspergillus clavatus NRRL 1]|uniref:Protein phosphatase regulatory subunit Gac1, putative n=1 Tax=Aspergillus clavatus (strain ATCC 1007 / CBS 513.65 / DSM 816 / NCTC 3887 / NRRL 1 / QM 1276 / 107) TaxID=344612 RepID=A1C7H3_ASPCL|nr:protein phosphatase regulatory subunit Gac1, putative [Aspergillus clavatus NRRL 1]EAW14344.1 protein phosphatase regulatory subunit Gac1, putative [Aspergillus clavatus NRRL 1]